MFLSSIFKNKYIYNVIRQIIPIYSSGFNALKKIILTDYLLDKSYYVEISEIFGSLLLRFFYGIYLFLSTLFLYVFGLRLRTRYYFFPSYFDIANISLCFPIINKILFNHSFFFLKKKFESHSYWSTLYLHKYPVHGQRRRTNASTSKKLNIVSRFSTNSNDSRS